MDVHADWKGHKTLVSQAAQPTAMALKGSTTEHSLCVLILDRGLLRDMVFLSAAENDGTWCALKGGLSVVWPLVMMQRQRC